MRLLQSSLFFFVFIDRFCNALDSFADISCFDNGFHLDSKEKIREVAGYGSAIVIEQLERWWDKYRVSLKELDAEVAAAEQVMKGYLQELGYE